MTDNSSSAGTSRSQGPASKIKTFKGQQSKALGAVTAATTGRRGFLLTGATLGAGALLGRAVPGEDKLLRSPGSPAAGPTNADWATLKAKLSTHTLSRPGDSSLISRVGSSPSINSVREESFLNAMLAEAGCQNLTVHMCDTKPYGMLPRVPAYAKSDFVSQRLNPAGIRAVLNGMTHASQIHNGPSGGGAAIAFDALGGAVNRVHPQATAFVHRDALWGIQYSTSWASPGSASGVARAHQWLESYYSDVHPHGNGQAYQNYVDPDLKNWRQAYYGVNYPRLARIKGRYDPHNLFNFPQSITA
jgi:hypothetical protein